MAYQAAQAVKSGARRSMALRFAGNPTLKRRATTLDTTLLSKQELQGFFEDLEFTMREHQVASLSAPQVGRSTQAFVMEVWEERSLVDRTDDETITHYQDQSPKTNDEMEEAIQAVIRRTEEVQKRYDDWEKKGRLVEDLNIWNVEDPDVRDLIQLNPCDPEIFINPSYEPLSDDLFLYYESSASTPGMMVRRTRHRDIKCKWITRFGEERTTFMTAVDSREYQQMVDFLNGISPQDDVEWEDIVWYPELTRRDDICVPKIRDFLTALPKEELHELFAWGFDPFYPPPNDELLRMCETFKAEKAAGNIKGIAPGKVSPLRINSNFGDAILDMATQATPMSSGAK